MKVMWIEIGGNIKLSPTPTSYLPPPLGWGGMESYHCCPLLCNYNSHLRFQIHNFHSGYIWKFIGISLPPPLPPGEGEKGGGDIPPLSPPPTPAFTSGFKWIKNINICDVLGTSSNKCGHPIQKLPLGVLYALHPEGRREGYSRGNPIPFLL